jgi:hypothetical protein
LLQAEKVALQRGVAELEAELPLHDITAEDKFKATMDVCFTVASQVYRVPVIGVPDANGAINDIFSTSIYRVSSGKRRAGTSAWMPCTKKCSR